MKKIIERLLVFLLGIPAIFALVMLLPHKHNLALNIVVVFFSALGTVEFSSMLEKKQIKIPKIESFILGALIPLSYTLMVSFKLPISVFIILGMGGISWALISGIFSRSNEIDNITTKIIGRFSTIIYPSIFMCWIVVMGAWKNPAAILLFFFITFGNDSLAWLFGSLFGEKNRGIITVSPNKSIAGFIGGMLGSILVALGAAFVFPNIFLYPHEDGLVSYMLLKVIVLGFCTGTAAMLGDLAESAIKRSCNFKDSGNFMLGRGGVLDSIDSIALAAPVFYLFFTIFFR